MTTFVHALSRFVHDLGSVGWTALAIGIGLHLLRLAFRCPAWRNILRASYPDARLPLRSVTGAYLAGVGINSILPARTGDALKLFLVKRRVEGTHYPTLAATLIPETLFDSFVAAIVVTWALASGGLPGFGVLPSLGTVDWSWPYRHQYVAAIVIGSVFLGGVLGLIWAQERIESFWARVRQGFAILRSFRGYLLRVVTWQTVSWALRLASLYWFLKAFHMPATVNNALVVLATQSISTLLPITPGGVGTVQGLLIAAFRDKVDTATVLSFSVGMYVAITIASLTVGFLSIGLMLRTFRWRQVIRPDKLAENQAGP